MTNADEFQVNDTEVIDTDVNAMEVNDREVIAPSKPNTGSNLTFLWLSSRPISKRQLCTLLCLHPAPIYLVVSKGS